MKLSTFSWRTALLGAMTVFFLGGITPSHLSGQPSEPVYDLAELDAAPQLADMTRTVEDIRRAYPAALRNQGVAGRVQIEAIVDADGRVEENSLRVLHSDHPGLAEAALTVAPRMRFRPGRKNGSNVRARVIIPITFQS